MNKLIIIFALFLTGCSQTTDYGGCSVRSTSNGAEVFCKDGTSTVVVNGLNGSPGTDGKGIAIVPLCPGTTTYPNVFIEIAFLIDGALYATYSANDGFSTELPPGNYTSNAIGSSCNFTVNPDMTISH